MKPSTATVWAGEARAGSGEGTPVPIVQSVAFGYGDVEGWLDVALGRKPGDIYSRNTNPTARALEEKLRVLEGAEAAASFASGMSAISNTLFTFLRPGDRVVTVKDTCGGPTRSSSSSCRGCASGRGSWTHWITTRSRPRWRAAAGRCTSRRRPTPR
jgi:cystathionine gamma-synthase